MCVHIVCYENDGETHLIVILEIALIFFEENEGNG